MCSVNAAVDHFWRRRLLTDLLTRALDGPGEDVADTDGVLAEDMGVNARGASRLWSPRTRRVSETCR